MTFEKQVLGFHFSITNVTLPLPLSASLHNSISVADTVVKQRFFSPPLLFILPRNKAVPFSQDYF